jgi:hypothetical protein
MNIARRGAVVTDSIVTAAFPEGSDDVLFILVVGVDVGGHSRHAGVDAISVTP